MIVFSIVIPHKNSFSSLIKLLNSIPENEIIQVIIVDDNSDEDVLENLKKYPFNKNVTLIFCNNNGGAGKARNIGVSEAKGKWILFADADDYFLDDLLKKLEKYSNSESDIIYFYPDSINVITQQRSFRHKAFEKLLNDYLNDSSVYNETKLRIHFTVPWAKMIKRALIMNYKIKFDEVMVANDMYFSVISGFYAKTISVDSNRLYMVTSSTSSLTMSMNKFKFFCRYMVLLRTNKFLFENKLFKYQFSILYYLVFSYRYGCRNIIRNLFLCIKYKSNPLIGLSKILSYRKKVLEIEGKIS